MSTFTVDRTHFSILVFILPLIAIPRSASEFSCYDCTYRQKGGNPEKNWKCLHPNGVSGITTNCSDDKPMCIKATAITKKFGLVMERGCFPDMPAVCKDLEPLDNSDAMGLFFGATLLGVESDTGDSIIRFEDVRACFCDWDECNNEPGEETNSLRYPPKFNSGISSRSAKQILFGRSIDGNNPNTNSNSTTNPPQNGINETPPKPLKLKRNNTATNGTANNNNTGGTADNNTGGTADNNNTDGTANNNANAGGTVQNNAIADGATNTGGATNNNAANDTSITSINTAATDDDCTKDPGKCLSHECYSCNLGIECHRMHYAKKLKCRNSTSCFIFTKLFAFTDFTERGCGDCNSFQSTSVNRSKNDKEKHKCISCGEKLCNSISTKLIDYPESIIFILILTLLLNGHFDTGRHFIPQ